MDAGKKLNMSTIKPPVANAAFSAGHTMLVIRCVCVWIVGNIMLLTHKIRFKNILIR